MLICNNDWPQDACDEQGDAVMEQLYEEHWIILQEGCVLLHAIVACYCMSHWVLLLFTLGIVVSHIGYCC